MISFELAEEKIMSSGYTAVDLTKTIEEVLRSRGFKTGIVTVYSPEEHVIITLIEYEPNLLSDLENFIKRYSTSYESVLEALLGKEVTVPAVNGVLDLGTFKKIVMVDLSHKEGLKKVYVAIEGIHS